MLDFYLHDMQHSAPMRGLAPAGSMERDLEVALDELLLHFLYYDCLQLQLLLVRGLEFQTIAAAKVPLRALMEGGMSPSTGSPRLELTRLELPPLTLAKEPQGSALRPVNPKAKEPQGSALRPVGHVNLTVQVHAQITELARGFIARQQVGASSSPSAFPRTASSAAAAGKAHDVALLEEFPRHLGCTYVLVVKIISVSEKVGGMEELKRLASGGAEVQSRMSRRRLVVLHQLLDFDCATEGRRVDGGTESAVPDAGKEEGAPVREVVPKP